MEIDMGRHQASCEGATDAKTSLSSLTFISLCEIIY